jgi:transcriptional antiterminator Rof (Rho-off)
MVESKYSPIDCGDYDYLKIACLRDLRIGSAGNTLQGPDLKKI